MIWDGELSHSAMTVDMLLDVGCWHVCLAPHLMQSVAAASNGMECGGRANRLRDGRTASCLQVPQHGEIGTTQFPTLMS
jgi:hypothetical protein